MLQNWGYRYLRKSRHDLYTLTDNYSFFLLPFFSSALLNANVPLPENCRGGRRWVDRWLGYPSLKLGSLRSQHDAYARWFTGHTTWNGPRALALVSLIPRGHQNHRLANGFRANAAQLFHLPFFRTYLVFPFYSVSSLMLLK